jgi:hypothetical protein
MAPVLRADFACRLLLLRTHYDTFHPFATRLLLH